MQETSPTTELVEEKALLIQVPVVIGDQSFDDELATYLHEIDRRGAEQVRRYTAEWKQTVRRMRDNFLRLHPVDADDSATSSDVIVDCEKIRTLFYEYPPDATDDDDHRYSTRSSSPTDTPGARLPGRYQVRIDASGVVKSSITVTVKLSTLVVRAARPDSQLCTTQVPIPSQVQKDRLRALLSVDGVLTVEGPLTTTPIDEKPAAGSRWKRAKTAAMMKQTGGKLLNSDPKETSDNENEGTVNGKDEGVDGTSIKDGDPAAKSSSSAGDAASPAEGQTGGQSKEKVGVPIFRDELGTRRMYLAVEIGTIYRPRDVIIQVVKENRIQIRAKNYEKTKERKSKNKFTKEYELGEKIETFTLQGGLTADGKLIISAYAKGHGPADE